MSSERSTRVHGGSPPVRTPADRDAETTERQRQALIRRIERSVGRPVVTGRHARPTGVKTANMLEAEAMLAAMEAEDAGQLTVEIPARDDGEGSE